jgi:DNA-binding transcriptional regulator LsrR (DeoR family)
MVEIRVHKRIATNAALEREFAAQFNLKNVMLVESAGREYAENLSAAGQLAAWHLEEVLQEKDTLAISWGTGVSAAVNALAPKPTLQIEVVQMIGSVGTVDSLIDGPELARRLAVKLGGKYYYLHAPLFVDNRLMRDALLEQPTIHQTMKRARQANVALVGIGTTENNLSSFLRARHLNETQLAALRAQGAVGETSGHHFDIDGGAGFDINDRVVGLDLNDLKKIPHVIAVACGLAKSRGILGAVRGGYINALATDDMTALAIMEEAKKQPALG